LRVADIAQLLGVSRQRANQLTREPNFPVPDRSDRRGRAWSREAIEEWLLEVNWFESKPWRRR
jgi:predicted DNA-binding transcriptional regulator AlpA